MTLALDPHVAAEVRRVYPRVLARLLTKTRALDRAEDAVQEAIERGLRVWPIEGPPESIEAWLVTVATNRHRDAQRRRVSETEHASAVTALADASPWSATGLRHGLPWDDELLRLLLACCDPAITVSESAAIALATVIGLSGRELAAAFLVTPRTMEQRLLRARRRLAERRGSLELPDAQLVAERLAPALATLQLVFNEGYWSAADDAPIRRELTALAIELTRSLLAMLPTEPEVEGLLAAMLLHEARAAARLDATGRPVPLPEQDRTRWSREGIARGKAHLERALARGAPGPYQLEAAIAAVHCEAAHADETDWRQIALLYEMLEAHRPSPVVRVNRAFAVSRVDGPRAGLALLDEAASEVSKLESAYPRVVRGTLLAELGRHEDAAVVLEAAIPYARNAHEADEIHRMLERVRARRDGD